MGDRPYIKLVRMLFISDDFHIFTLNGDGNTENFTDEHINLINDLRRNGRSFSLQNISGKEYLLVNTLRENCRDCDVRLVICPYQLVYKNTGKFVNEIRFKEAILKFENIDKIKIKNIDYCVVPTSLDEEINIKIAYACKAGDPTSLIYERLIGENSFNYFEDIDMARNVINYEYETFIIECKNNSKEKFKCKLVYEMKEDGLRYIAK